MKNHLGIENKMHYILLNKEKKDNLGNSFLIGVTYTYTERKKILVGENAYYCYSDINYLFNLHSDDILNGDLKIYSVSPDGIIIKNDHMIGCSQLTVLKELGINLILPKMLSFEGLKKIHSYNSEYAKMVINYLNKNSNNINTVKLAKYEKTNYSLDIKHLEYFFDLEDYSVKKVLLSYLCFDFKLFAKIYNKKEINDCILDNYAIITKSFYFLIKLDKKIALDLVCYMSNIETVCWLKNIGFNSKLIQYNLFDDVSIRYLLVNLKKYNPYDSNKKSKEWFDEFSHSISEKELRKIFDLTRDSYNIMLWIDVLKNDIEGILNITPDDIIKKISSKHQYLILHFIKNFPEYRYKLINKLTLCSVYHWLNLYPSDAQLLLHLIDDESDAKEWLKNRPQDELYFIQKGLLEI